MKGYGKKKSSGMRKKSRTEKIKAPGRPKQESVGKRKVIDAPMKGMIARIV